MAGTSEHIVRADDITKTFGDIVALDRVSLSFEPGIIYGLLGPNGAGKTTLIRVLTTLLRPDSGNASVAGIDLLAHPKEARTRLGLGGQFAAVDDYLTGRENVEMVGRLYNLTKAEATRRTTEILERIGLTDAADRTVKTYSGGMRRRLDLAASMVGRPQVLFLDEPTTGIDPRSRIEIWGLIEDLVAGGTTILLTSQYLDEADRLADRIGVIDEGRLITEGTPTELKAKLGGDVIELHVELDDRHAAHDVISRLSADPPIEHEQNGQLSFPAPEAATTLLRTVRALDDAGIVPIDIALRKPTLDEVFLAFTGRTAAEVAKPEPKRGRSRRSR